jgi:hypothetical protein
MGVTVVGTGFDMGSGLTFGNETVTVPLPVGSQAGDLAIFVIDIPSSNPLTVGAVNIIVPSGTADVTGSPISNGTAAHAGRVVWKILDGTETVFTATRTTTNTNGVSGCLIVLRGVNPAAPFHQISSHISNGIAIDQYPLTLPAITTTRRTGLLMVHGVRGSVGAFDPTSPGFTELIDEIMFGSRHLKVDFRADLDPGTYNSFILDTNPGHPTTTAFTFLLAIAEGGSKNWAQRGGNTMKNDFQSDEDLLIRFPPHIDKTTGEYITGGTDVVTLTIKKPNGDVLTAEGGILATYDADVDMWTYDVDVGLFAAGEWKVKAVTDDANGLPQWQTFTWGTGQAEDVLEIKKIQFNNWKVIGTQLLVYDNDGTTILKTYDLFDDNGDASGTRVFERRVSVGGGDQ